MGSSSVIDADPEQARLTILRSYRIIDTPPEAQFDELVRRAQEHCGCPISALVLVDETRCWFKARIGFDPHEIPREVSFCNQAFRNEGIFVVKDARLDQRFAQLPIVVGDGFVFYAGVPLLTPQGHSIGTLCVLDREPRSLSELQEATLKSLADEAMKLLELRRIRHTPSPVSRPPHPMGTVAPFIPGKLLVVDDDDAVRSFVCVATRRLGYQVIDAANGIEALKQIETHPGQVSVVLTDINMPLMDGIELVKELKKLPDGPAIAVMSGRFDPYVRNCLQSEGINALLSKPFTSETLKSTLRQAIAGH